MSAQNRSKIPSLGAAKRRTTSQEALDTATHELGMWKFAEYCIGCKGIPDGVFGLKVYNYRMKAS